jgi:hypothetical protein
MSKLFGVVTDYDYNRTHRRGRITVWSGQFMSDLEATGLSLPSGGYMLRTYWGRKIRVRCPAPRTEANYREVDAAINAAMQGADHG